MPEVWTQISYVSNFMAAFTKVLFSGVINKLFETVEFLNSQAVGWNSGVSFGFEKFQFEF